ncbi:probable LRR receptor-like serine/threonine-protein kinase At4g36180 [Gossypium arboreum]|uniref:probable LRR receptor-like serine/threonine-protein kinase At4g36180 n=1 Tax=Gossypium arboreum TaxID=29729 RepID=UPI0022F1D736|nr:probable LRR receptor-like serine/threonine-protein kinase At4g36180 [Gossypium arboreum]
MADPSNRSSSWKGQNCCSWHGIDCSDSFHVTAIDLRNPKPDNLILDTNSQLVSTSDVPSTALTGPIHPSLFYPLLISDTLTSVSTTSVSQSIDDHSSIYTTLSSTRTIHEGSLYTYMNRGNLYAPNLSWLQRLNNLRKLKLNGVDLSKASRSNLWAKSVSTLSKLRFLELSNCRISGEVPVEQLLNLTKLSELYMDYNFLASKIPSKLANLTSLSVLDLTRSNLQGHIPYLPQVKTLHVGNNSDVMVDLHSMFAVPWPRLESIDISSTHVIGSIPPSIANITSLVDFIAYNSLIQGRIPASMMNLTRLEMLSLDMNNISGEISPSISNLKSLQLLSLLQNSFHGLIPDTICSISSLRYLLLAGNSFTGNIPNCIGQLNDLSYFEVSSNKMNGSIPSLSSFFRNSTP